MKYTEEEIEFHMKDKGIINWVRKYDKLNDHAIFELELADACRKHNDDAGFHYHLKKHKKLHRKAEAKRLDFIKCLYPESVWWEIYAILQVEKEL